MRTVRITCLSLAAASVAALAGSAAAPESGRAAELRENGVTVLGIGVVRSVPDRAEFSFGVQSQGKSASQTFAAANAEMAKVIAALKNAGVNSDDIQTEQISLSTRYSDDGDEVTGFVASSSVHVKLRNLNRAGAVIDAAVTAGANQIYGPSLSRSDQNELYRDALKAAITDARAKAQAIAAAAGVSVGQVVAVDETGGTPVPFEARSAAPAADVPIEAGTQEIQATVVVGFTIV